MKRTIVRAPADAGVRGRRWRRGPRLACGVLLGVLATPAVGMASTFSWNLDANGNWNDPANWTLVAGPLGPGYPNAVDDAAEFSAIVTTANRTITIPNGVTITIGLLELLDNHNITIQALGSGTLRFESLDDEVASVRMQSNPAAHTIAAPVVLSAQLQLINFTAGTITFSGGIGETGGARAVLISMGVTRFASAVNNTYTGLTTVTAGTLELAHVGGTTAIAGDLRIGGGPGPDLDVVRLLTSENIGNGSTVRTNTEFGVFEVNGMTETIGLLELDSRGQAAIGNGTLTVDRVEIEGGRITADAAGRLVLSQVGQGVDSSSSTDDTPVFQGGTIDIGAGGRTFEVHPTPGSIDLDVTSIITGAGGFTKVDDGTMRLSGNNTYTGETTVNTGTLIVNGQQAGSNISLVGGQLLGDGLVGSITATGGQLSAGVGPGVLTAANLTMQADSRLIVEIDGANPGTFDRLRVPGSVSLSNTLLSVSRGFDPIPGTTFTIVDNGLADPVSGTFANLPEGAEFDAGNWPFTISYVGGDGNDVVLTAGQPTLTYFFAEGATGGFFDTDLLIANPNGQEAQVTLNFLEEDGTEVVVARAIPAQSRATIRLDEIAGLEQTAASIEVISELGLPLVVERTMFWDTSSYGGHTGEATTLGTDWHFAEGAQGFFDTYFLVQNPNDESVDVIFNFLREQAPPFEVVREVAPRSRLTLYAGEYPELKDLAFGAVVSGSQPIVVERAMYFGTTPTQLWTGGHASSGVNQAAQGWFFAEGATGSFFDTFILMSNPNDEEAEVTLRFLLEDGQTVEVQKTVPAEERLTVNIEAESDPRLHQTALSTVVSSSVPIVAERSMYWHAGEAEPWGESHHSVGMQDAGTRWGLAEGRVGGPLDFSTYILLANSGDTAAEVSITYLREAGDPIVKNYSVPPTSRVTVDVRGVVPELQDEAFGAVITATNDQPIFVERAMYWDTGDILFAGGTNATAVRLP